MFEYHASDKPLDFCREEPSYSASAVCESVPLDEFIIQGHKQQNEDSKLSNR